MPKIYDCFCYFNEDMLLELRLETLWEHVDFFVISEAMYTQTGNPKPLNFSPQGFAKYMSKIRYLVVDHLASEDAWKNENRQRDFLEHGLHDAAPDDWILVSDLDEIPSPQMIRTYDPTRYKRGDFMQRPYSYFLNNLCVDNGRAAVWFGTKVTTYRRFKEFFGTSTAVRTYKSSGLLRVPKRLFFHTFNRQIIYQGGWHFSWALEPEKIILKLESIADQKFVRPEFKELSYIEAMIHSGRDILNPSAPSHSN